MSDKYEHDIELAKRIKNEDPEADKILYSMFDELIRKHVEYTVFDRRDWKDVISETWKAIFSALRTGKYQGSSKLKTYILGIVINQIRTYIARKKREDQWSQRLENLEDFSEEPHNIEEDLEETERHRQLKNIIKQMPPKLREIIFLRYFYREKELLPYNKIARILNIPLSTVKNRLHSAYKKLAKEYEKGTGSFFQMLQVFIATQKLCIKFGTR